MPQYELLREVGAEFNIGNAGYRAIEILRLEKRYLGALRSGA